MPDFTSVAFLKTRLGIGILEIYSLLGIFSQKILIYCLALGILKFSKQNYKSGIICPGNCHFVVTKTWQHWFRAWDYKVMVY